MQQVAKDNLEGKMMRKDLQTQAAIDLLALDVFFLLVQQMQNLSVVEFQRKH